MVQLTHKIQPNDNLILCYSGHGLLNKEEEDGYWFLNDCDQNNYSYNGISNNELLTKLKAVKARHILLLVDSCFSGSLFTEKGLAEADTDQKSDPLESYPSRWALTAGRLEPVTDGFPSGHSPFSKYLIEYLEDNKKERLPI